ncbi:hypothetical protein J2Z21_002043 [Streptomyces griseochromogenes]|uniref:Transposase n=1 Tax=Streptomyces griseochromogenes TaxID=68214 RepID=A0ABS4LPC4_9ACTN|nr:hypothetical protein [Streptomyces griseochromogenes]
MESGLPWSLWLPEVCEGRGGEGEGGGGPSENRSHHQAESNRPSIALRFCREHTSQKY